MKDDRKQTDDDSTGGFNRREFFGALGAAAITSAFLAGGEAGADDSTVWYYDSFGEVVEADPGALALGILPPPLPPGVEAPGNAQQDQAEAAGHHSRASASGKTKQPVSSAHASDRPRDHHVTPKDIPGGNPTPTAAAAGYPKYNFLFIVVDQMRNPRWLPGMQANGNSGQAAIDAILPNIAAIRNQSYELPYCFAAATNCTPNRAAMVTGLYSQQTCMFKTINSSSAPTLRTAYWNVGRLLAAAGYQTTWIGKWHLSDDGTGNVNGQNGPVDYGFSANGLNIPTPPAGGGSNLYPVSVASPDGSPNGGTGGVDLTVAANEPTWLNPSPLPHGFSKPPVAQLRDGAIADAFINYFLAQTFPAHWFAAVSFVNPHDISDFPYAYALANTPGFGIACGFTPLSPGYAPPSTLGEPSQSMTGPDDNIDPPLSLLYPDVNGAGIPSWNYPDDPATQPYATPPYTAPSIGKPGLQAYQEYKLSYAAGPILTLSAWQTFLNYYFWMQACVDTQIGRIITALNGTAGAHPEKTIIVFTSDHGEYAGSHSIHAKGGGLYDECLNVPLYISMPEQRMLGQTSSKVRDYLCSSVDLLPFFYTMAIGTNAWRTNPGDPVYYLRGREAIEDVIYTRVGTPKQHRVSADLSLPYVLHTTDEYCAEGAYLAAPYGNPSTCPTISTATLQPDHAIAFRTVDFLKKVTTPAAFNSYGYAYGGGKLGIYSYWPTHSNVCSASQSATQPVIPAPPNPTNQQFEFYDYSNNYMGGSLPNFGELGNQVVLGPDGNPSTGSLSSQYYAAFQNIAAGELYLIYDEFYNVYTSATAPYGAYGVFESYIGLSGCKVPPDGGS